MKKMLVLLVSAVCMFANTKTSDKSGRTWQTAIHNINQVEMCISNYGKFGQNEAGNNVGCWWPEGSLHNYIFGAGIWFGTVDSLTGDTLVTVGYNPHDGTSECAPGLKDMDPDDPLAIIYMYPDNWPAPTGTFPMAPQARISHQDSWCCFNDCDSTYHSPGDTRPIGIEAYQTVYAWNIPELEDVIFFTYHLKNVSDHNLHDCYFGVMADCDIGNESGGANDIMSGIVGKWYAVGSESIWVDNLAYQYQDVTEPGWAQIPGAIGFDLLATPMDLGMTALKRFTLSIDPSTDEERYLTLAGYNFSTGIYEPYDTVPSQPDDQRFLMSSGPFDLAVDSSVTLVFAVLFADWHGLYGTPDIALALVDAWAQYQYDNNWILSVKEMPQTKIASPLMTISPNPITNKAQVSFSLTNAGFVSLKLYNTIGQLVKEVANGHRPVGNYNIDLNLNQLSQGTYLLLLETPNGKSSRSLVIAH